MARLKYHIVEHTGKDIILWFAGEQDSPDDALRQYLERENHHGSGTICVLEVTGDMEYDWDILVHAARMLCRQHEEIRGVSVH